MAPEDPFDLARFVAAEDQGGVYDAAIGELRRGRKTSHWMWFVFPQIAGLGRSATRAAVRDLLARGGAGVSPASRARSTPAQSTEIVADMQERTAEQIFGGIDAQKLHSSMTLFLRAAPDEPRFRKVLAAYFGGRPDAATDERL